MTTMQLLNTIIAKLDDKNIELPTVPEAKKAPI